VTIRHHFELPGVKPGELGHEVYRKPPWAIFRKGQSWVYLGISPDSEDHDPHHMVVFNNDYSRGEFYHPSDVVFRQGNLHSLTLLPTDQILLAQLLADRQACFIHSAGVIVRSESGPSASDKHGQSETEFADSEDIRHSAFDNRHSLGVGLLFVGHSEAGKSTTVRLMQDRAEILCDDRNIVRREGGGKGEGKDGGDVEPGHFRVYGSWSHGEVPLVSASSAPLRAILFIKQSADNRLVPLTDRGEVLKRLLACVIRPLETAAWWQKTFSVVEALAREVPCYIMEFDKSGRIVERLLELSTDFADYTDSPQKTEPFNQE
jgi:hypothetical protein